MGVRTIITTIVLTLALITICTTTAAAISCTCDDNICVNETGWWRDSGAFTVSTTPIQAAVDNAIAGETICVAAGNYNTKVIIRTPHLTLRGEGAGVVTVNVASSSDHAFEVTANYVNISGFNATGATDFPHAGIYLDGVDHCNISENTASNNYHGIDLGDSSNYNTLTNNTALNNRAGIYLYSSSNNMFMSNTVSCNTPSNNNRGIHLYSSSNNTLTNNTASNNSDGIYLYSSSNYNTLTSNIASNNNDGIKLSHSSNYNTLMSNNASLNNYNGIQLYSSGNNTLTCNNCSNNSDGIELSSSSNNTITNNTASNNYCGIYLYSSNNYNTLANNIVSNNYDGIYLRYSSNYNTLVNNTASNNNRGIELYDSSNYNTLANNIVSNNFHGIYLRYSSNYNTLVNNTASNNNRGIYLHSSSNNTLASNTANSNDDYGIYLYDSNDNLIYNNYFDNTKNAYSYGSNQWNTTKTNRTNIIDGLFLGGNYWSDYVGVDNDNDNDGLGDTLTPYNSSGEINSGGDYHPLVMLDNTPLPVITYLHNITHARTYINWTWTDPVDPEFSKVMVYLNGVFQEDVNSGVQCYNATLLTSGTTYEISTRTVDTVGNINHTWVNHTATTAPAATTDTTSPVSYPEFVNITIDGNKSVIFANHSDSPTEGNWIFLRAGDPIKLPSPFTLTYNGTNFSSSTNGRINVTVDIEDDTDYIVTYPHTTHDMFTNVTGKNSVGMHFNGTTYFADNRTDVYLVKISRTSLKDAFNNITDGNFAGFYDDLLGDPYETKLNESLDASGDMNLVFNEVDAGDYAIFILLNNSDLNKLSILSATTFQVLEYDSTTTVLSPEVSLGDIFNANISLTNAPTDTYKYIATLVHESAYCAEMQLKFNGTRAGTNLTLNGVEIIQGYEVLGVGLSSVNITTVLNTIRDGIDPINGSMVVNDTNAKNALISFDTGNLSHAGNYILLTGVYNSGDKLVAFNQSDILISTDSTAPVINSVTLNPTNPNTGDDITVTINVTDNVGVTSVTTEDVFLSYIGEDDTWVGTITAIDGNHTVNVSASDAAGNTAYDETANYTATVSIHPVVLVEDVTAKPNGYAVTSIMVNDVTGLGSGSITVTYNSSVVHVTNVTSGDGNALAVQDWNVDNSTGSVQILSQDGDTSHNGDVVFAHVTFHAVGECPDSTSLAISSSELIDYTSYNSIIHSVTNGTFSIIDDPPIIRGQIATPDVILNDNGRPRIPGTNVAVLNATVLNGGSGVMTVTIDLSSIGGSNARVMERIDGTDIWTVSTNAVDGINQTHELVVTATDKANNTNTSVIELTVLLRGDIVRDGNLNSADALYIAKYLVGKESMPSLLVGDMSPDIGDGDITSADALYLAKYLAGKEIAP